MQTYALDQARSNRISAVDSFSSCMGLTCNSWLITSSAGRRLNLLGETLSESLLKFTVAHPWSCRLWSLELQAKLELQMLS